MLKAIFLLNDCEVIADGISGFAFTLAAGDSRGHYTSAFKKNSIVTDETSRDYLTLVIDINGITHTALPGDMLFFNEDDTIALLSNPTDQLREHIINTSGLPVLATKHLSFD